MHGYLRHLANFAYVIEAGSISGAAARLEVSASTVSDSVRILESHVGEPLIRRHRNGVSPTSRGSALYEEARDIVSALGRALDADHAKAEEGVLSISLPEEIACNGFDRVLRRLRRDHPRLRLSLMVEESGQEASRPPRDLILKVSSSASGTRGLHAIWSKPVRLLAVASPGLLSGVKRKEAQQVGTLPFLAAARDQGGVRIVLADPEVAVQFNNTVPVSSAQSRLALARQGAGVAMCLCHCVEEDLKRGNLVQICSDNHAPRGVLSLLSANERVTQREQALMSVFTETFGGLAGETPAATHALH